MRRSLVRPLPQGCILDDVWLPMQAVLAGYRSVFNAQAIAWDYPTSLDAEFDRKVRTQAGIYQLLRILPGLFSSRNRLRWTFLSLKFGRLLLPEVLLVIFAATFWLPGALRVILLAAQLGLFALALLDGMVPEGAAIKRVTAPIRAIVVLLAAALCATLIFFRSPEQLWKKTRVQTPQDSPHA
jgi:hypothetical protein